MSSNIILYSKQQYNLVVFLVWMIYFISMITSNHLKTIARKSVTSKMALLQARLFTVLILCQNCRIVNISDSLYLLIFELTYTTTWHHYYSFEFHLTSN